MNAFANKDLRLVPRARSLRVEGTEVERQLWYRLRNRQLLNRKFRRQHPFEGYILDFVCEELKLAIELDGGQHAQETTKMRDDYRTRQLEHAGWTMVRFWNHEVIENIEGVMETIGGQISRMETA